MVRVGSARSNEFGGINGGTAGDQNGGAEVSVQSWYLHNKGWTVIRAKNTAVRERIAQNMEAACANNNIGYCQDHRTSLAVAAKPYGYDVSKVAKKVETDCSELVRVCCLYAGINVGTFNTASEVATLKATGKFDILKEEKYCRSADYLLRGDILVTRTKGHTVVALDHGDKVASVYPEKPKLSGWQQEDGGWRYYLDDTGEPVRNAWYEDGRWYWFDGAGMMVHDTWYRYKGDWYYLGPDGAMAKGQQTIGGKWYIMDDDGRMLAEPVILMPDQDGALRWPGLAE